MIKCLVSFTESLENPRHPLLGPNLRSLETFGLVWSKNFKTQLYFTIAHIASVFFVTSLFVDLFFTNHSFDEFLFNLSVAAVSAVSITKTAFFLYWQKYWLQLFNNISKEENSQTKKLDKRSIDIMKSYIKYSRFMTYIYWVLVLVTSLAMIFSPILKFLTTPKIRNGEEPFPVMISSWFPFDDTKLPGNAVAFCIHTYMCLLGSGVIASFDATAVTIMTYLKGQTLILQEKCRNLFGQEEEISKQEVWDRIKECHRHHEFILQQSHLFDSLLSPVMFLYVLVCSMSICCSVVQLSMEGVNTSQKIWILEYTVALALQLFIYCWHGNEIADQSYKTDRAIFESNWWRSDGRILKQLILLDGKLFDQMILNAGPFNTLSVVTFVSIMKGAYSFFTLLTQMQEDK